MTTPMPERIQRMRTKDWRMPAGAIYVGRPTVWRNPWEIGDPGHVWLALRGESRVRLPMALTARGVVDRFRRWLAGEFDPVLRPQGQDHPVYGLVLVPEGRDEVLKRLGELRGRDLACWCKQGEPCHASVLLELANR